MPPSPLNVADGLAFPPDAVTETFALIAMRRVGKSNAAVVMAEQMYDAGIPWVAIDPKGDWWGVRSSATGRSAGLSVIVFGGEHGDVPLLADAGTYMADLVAEQRISCVLDVSEFSKTDEVKFLYAFATRLLKVNRHPLHLFFEECDDYIPQSMLKDTGGISEAQLVRAFSKLVRQGGFKGIGSTLITQRPALVNNNVLSQTETMIALRTMFPDDQAQVKKWVAGHATKELTGEVMESLPSLKVGEAWVISPAFLHTTQRIQFHRRRTFDSGATPKLGEERREPTRLADVDLAAIKEAMAATIEKAQAADPKILGARIRELEAKLAAAHRAPVAAPEPPEPEYVALIDEAALDRYLEISELTRRTLTGIISGLEPIQLAVAELRDLSITIESHHLSGVAAVKPAGPSPAVRTSRRTESAPKSASPQARGDVESVILPDGEKAILTVVAQYPAGRVTRQQLTVMTGYKRSTRDAYVQRLKSRGLVSVANGIVTATQEGVEALGSDFEPLPTGPALRKHWLAKLPEGEALILGYLIDAYPRPLSREELSDATGYKRSTRDAYIQRLKSRQLVLVGAGGVAASDDLFLEA